MRYSASGSQSFPHCGRPKHRHPASDLLYEVTDDATKTNGNYWNVFCFLFSHFLHSFWIKILPTDMIIVAISRHDCKVILTVRCHFRHTKQNMFLLSNFLWPLWRPLVVPPGGRDPHFATPCLGMLPLSRHPLPAVARGDASVLNLWTEATNEKWGHLFSPEGLRRRYWMMKWAQLELHIVSPHQTKRNGAAVANSTSWSILF